MVMERNQTKNQFDQFATVILDKGPDFPLDYGIPPLLNEETEVGTRILVPIRNRECQATIIEIKTTPPSSSNLLPVLHVLSDRPLISPELLKLGKWISRYYCCSLRQAFKYLLPPSVRQQVKPKQQLYVKKTTSSKKLLEQCRKWRASFPSRAKVLDLVLNKPKGLFLSELLEQTKVSYGVVLTLQKENLLSVEPHIIDRSLLEEMEFFQSPPKILTEEQENTLKQIQIEIDSKRFHIHLIHGVTGSGKTEVYLQAIQYAREHHLGVIFLVPEIVLTSQTVEKLKSRFTERLGILHHRLSHGERSDMWHRIHQGHISIVIGARSAVFSPVRNLGLIIVDEEHDHSYKQTEKSPCYHARDVAVMRGKFSHATILLGSATPSIETFAKAERGKYHLSQLTQRATSAPLPYVGLIDMNREYERANGASLLSTTLLSKIKDRYSKGEQTLLFLNRRGYHTLQLCAHCKKSSKCPHCDCNLTYHKKSNRLICHLCLFSLSPPPRQCSHCHRTGTLSLKGVGTEQIEQILHAILPYVRVIRIDADTTRNKGSHEQLFKRFRSGKADILIGTQMITKGLHFPSVTLVGVLNSDHALHLPDFRASEHLFQLLTQVAGRSGRGPLKGEVLIQTFLPNHPLFQFAQKEDYTKFFKTETDVRQAFHFPPYTRLIKITFVGKDVTQTEQFALSFKKGLIQKLPSSFTIYPVIPSGCAKIKGQYRFKLLIKGENIYHFSTILSQCRPASHHVQLLVDIDPITIFY